MNVKPAFPRNLELSEEVTAIVRAALHFVLTIP